MVKKVWKILLQGQVWEDSCSLAYKLCWKEKWDVVSGLLMSLWIHAMVSNMFNCGGIYLLYFHICILLHRVEKIFVKFLIQKYHLEFDYVCITFIK